jgi:hypothetical protein
MNLKAFSNSLRKNVKVDKSIFFKKNYLKNEKVIPFIVNSEKRINFRKIRPMLDEESKILKIKVSKERFLKILDVNLEECKHYQEKNIQLEKSRNLVMVEHENGNRIFENLLEIKLRKDDYNVNILFFDR